MTFFKIQTRTFDTKKGMSTEVRSDGIVGDDVRLTIKSSVNGTLSPEREEVFNSLLTRYSLRMLYDEEFKDVSKS